MTEICMLQLSIYFNIKISLTQGRENLEKILVRQFVFRLNNDISFHIFVHVFVQLASAHMHRKF